MHLERDSAASSASREPPSARVRVTIVSICEILMDISQEFVVLNYEIEKYVHANQFHFTFILTNANVSMSSLYFDTVWTTLVQFSCILTALAFARQ